MHYPTGVKVKKTNNINYANRGMTLEHDINESNQYYLNNNIAVIYKKPTPISIIKVDYHSRKDATIKEAYFKTPSTTDYNGIYKGKYIDFEAKETTKQYFPLANIHLHQIEHLKSVTNHGAIAFLIVRFTKENKTFLLTANSLFEFLENNSRKSIPINYFEENGYIIKDTYNPKVDYIKILDIAFKGDLLWKNLKILWKKIVFLLLL